MRKIIGIACVALITTLIFAQEKSMSEEKFNAYLKSIPTIFQMELPKADFEKGILSGLSGIDGMASIFADLYASRKCTRKYDGISEWIYDFQQKSTNEDKRLVYILINLKSKYASEQSAQNAYKTLIMAEHVKNCGTENDIVDFVQIIK